MKILLIIIDGLGDRPIKELGNMTPLEAARTPNFDFLASQGICGLIEPVYQGSFPSSKDAHLSLFGYDLKKWHMARGVFEVLGIGMELGKEDIALRGNFSTVNSNFKIVDRRAGRISDTRLLVKALQEMTIEGIKFLLGIAVSHRLGIILRGKYLSDKISDGDFHKTGIKAPKILAKENKREAKFTARVLNKFLLRSHQILEDHPLNKKRIKKGQLPANYILVREAGKLKKLQSFEKKWGLRACCIAGGVLYKGIARVLGMDLIKVRGATGKADTDLEKKFKAVKKSLEKYDFCYLHIKATDIFSHDGDFLGKKKFLEKIDRNLSILLNPVRGQRVLTETQRKQTSNGVNLKNTLIVVTGDHSTPCKIKEHTADPLPVLVFGLGKDGVHPVKSHKVGIPPKAELFNGVKKFSEKECQKGKIGKIKSLSFMRKILTCNF